MATTILKLSEAPYPGLRPFRPDESDIFFGRERQTDELLSRLGEHRFLAVVGPSGCGKSSLVEAGLRPALATGFMAKAGSHWRVAYLRPGGRPLQNLARGLLDSGILGPERTAEPDAQVLLEAALRTGPLGLVEIVHGSALESDANLLVLVDQFEELFRFSAGMNRDEAESFVSLLLASASAPGERIYVTITMRSDYIGECTPFHGLPEAINDGLYLTPRLTREECSACITGPARMFGGEVEPALVNRLLNDFGPDPDQLPLLQHALLRMWNRHAEDRRANKKTILCTADYEQIGGLARSLSDHADEAFAELDAVGQHIAELMFRCLSDAETAKRDRRSPARVEEIAALAGVETADVICVADRFRRTDRCFLMPPQKVELKAETIIDVSHESLLRQWGKAVAWLDEEAELVTLYRRLKKAVRESQQGGVLMSEASLDRAIAWRTRVTPAWACRYGTAEDFAVVCEFIDARRQEREAARLRESKARSARRQRWIASIALGVLAVISTGTLVILPLSFEWERTSYYAGYATRYGEPFGIGRKLTAREVRHRPLSFRIVKAGMFGRVRRVEAINSRGKLTEVPQDYQVVALGQPLPTSRWEYDYDAAGNIAAEHQYNIRDPARKELVQSKLFLPSETESERHAVYIGADRAPAPVKDPWGNAYYWAEALSYSKRDRTEKVSYLGSSGEPVHGRDRAFATKREYDEQGYLISMTSLDRSGKVMNDVAGNAVMKVTKHDEFGNPLEEAAFDAASRRTKVDDGFAIQRVVYDEFGNAIDEAYFDENDRPVVTKQGWQRATVQRDDHGSVQTIHFLDAEGKPTYNTDACYGFTQQRDAMDRVTSWTCLAADGAPKPSKYGYVNWTGIYDLGRLMEETYRGADGRLVTGTQGHARVFYRYDDRGRRTAVIYHGVDDKPVNSSEGYARSITTYEDEARVEWTHFQGVDNRPTRDHKGRVSVKRVRDVRGNIIEERYFDERDQPVITEDGHAGWRATLDSQGQEIERSYLGTSGEPAFGKNGIAGWKAEYNELGRQTATHYLDPAGKPVVRVTDGIAGSMSNFDQWGNEIEKRYFDLDGKPAISFQGDAGWQATYDRRGHQTMRRYIDLSGAPTLHSWDDVQRFTGRGYAIVNQAFDPYGNLIEKEYLGRDGERVADPTGEWRGKYEYDDRGRPLRQSYFGTKNEAVKIIYGYHSKVVVYDDSDRSEETRYLGVDGEHLVECDQGYARIVQTRDPYGRVVRKQVFGTSGERVTWRDDDAHLVVTTWDERGRATRNEYWGKLDPPNRLGANEYRYDNWSNRSEERHLGPNRTLRTTDKELCAVRVWRYSERQELLEEECRGVNGALSPNLAQRIAHIVYAYDQPGNLISETYYDQDNHPFIIANGYAGVRYGYDVLGRKTEERYVDETDRPVNTRLGYARLTIVYDGRRVEEAYFLKDYTSVKPGDTPVKPVARVESVLDKLGRKTLDRYLGPGGQPALLGGDGQHITLYEYDPFGNVRALRYLDTNKQPTHGYARFFEEAPQLCSRWVAIYNDDGKLAKNGQCEQ